MKEIRTLVPDIYDLVKTKGWMTDAQSQHLAQGVAQRVQAQFETQTRKAGLRLSKMGSGCPKALWHSVHTPEQAEPLPAWAEVKYCYGHLIEAMAITMIKAAGHEVTGEQDALYLDGVEGHRDCVVDGAILDVKSTSSMGFGKFKTGSIAQNDSFGYLDQLDAYICASAMDPLVRVKDRGYLLAIDKQLGHMYLYEHELREQSIRDRIKSHKQIVGRSTPPACECGTVKQGESGNRALDLKASYSAFKHCCFPGLRTFIYSKGPVYLTHVERLPDVPEVDRFGKHIYG